MKKILFLGGMAFIISLIFGAFVFAQSPTPQISSTYNTITINQAVNPPDLSYAIYNKFSIYLGGYIQSGKYTTDGNISVYDSTSVLTMNTDAARLAIPQIVDWLNVNLSGLQPMPTPKSVISSTPTLKSMWNTATTDTQKISILATAVAIK